MKIKNLATAALLALGVVATGSQAMAQDRDHWRGGDRREYREERRDYGRYERDRERHEREYQRERERERRDWVDRREYYGRPYYAPAPPAYYRPGISGYLYFGRP